MRTELDTFLPQSALSSTEPRHRCSFRFQKAADVLGHGRRNPHELNNLKCKSLAVSGSAIFLLFFSPFPSVLFPVLAYIFRFKHPTKRKRECSCPLCLDCWRRPWSRVQQVCHNFYYVGGSLCWVQVTVAIIGQGGTTLSSVWPRDDQSIHTR